MKITRSPLITVAIDHAAYGKAPVSVVATDATTEMMTALMLRSDPHVGVGSLALYYGSTSAGLSPILKAAEGTVLTFLLIARTPKIDSLTDLPNPPLVRCYSNTETQTAGEILELKPNIGMGIPVQSTRVSMPYDGPDGVVDVVRAASGKTVADLKATSGRLNGVLDGLPTGQYGLRRDGQVTQNFVLQDGLASQPFGLLEIVLTGATVRPPHRIVQGSHVHARDFSISLPARACHVCYTIIGLDDTSARIRCSDGSVVFGPMTKTSLNGQAGLTVTSAQPTLMVVDGPDYTLEFTENTQTRRQKLPSPTGGQIGVEVGASGAYWVSRHIVYQ